MFKEFADDFYDKEMRLMLTGTHTHTHAHAHAHTRGSKQVRSTRGPEDMTRPTSAVRLSALKRDLSARAEKSPQRTCTQRTCTERCELTVRHREMKTA